MKIIDSSVWVDHFNGRETLQTSLLVHLLATETVGIGDLILAEVLQGFSSNKDMERAKNHFIAIPIFSMVGTRVALRSAENYRTLRRKGITVRKTMDMLIGTFCIENGHSLLHSDKDFDLLEKHLGLKGVS